jgi:hypothetical protein
MLRRTTKRLIRIFGSHGRDSNQALSEYKRSFRACIKPNSWFVFDPEDESTLLRNVDELIPDYTASLLLVSLL